MTARPVRGYIEFPVGSGRPCVGARVVARIYTGADGQAAFGVDDNGVPVGSAACLSDGSGTWTMDLEPNEDIDPEGTVWLVSIEPPDHPAITLGPIEVPNSSGPHDVVDLLVDLPGALPTGALRAHAALSSAHGVTGDIVGTDGAQTLTNKALQSPAFAFTSAAAAAARAAMDVPQRSSHDLREWGNVAAGGDDTSLAQQAVDDLAALGGGNLILASGLTFRWSSVVLKTNVGLMSKRRQHSYTAHPARIVGIGGTDTTVIDTPDAASTGMFVSGVWISGSSTARRAIRIRHADYVTIADVMFQGFQGEAVVQDYQSNVLAMRNILALQCLQAGEFDTPTGVFHCGGNDNFVSACEIGASRVAGSASGNCIGVLITSEGNFFDAIVSEFVDIPFLVKSNYNSFTNCRADLSWRHGWRFENSSENVLSSCRSLNNGRGAANTYSGFSFDPLSKDNCLAACRATIAPSYTGTSSYKYAFEDATTPQRNSFAACSGVYTTKEFSWI